MAPSLLLLLAVSSIAKAGVVPPTYAVDDDPKNFLLPSNRIPGSYQADDAHSSVDAVTQEYLKLQQQNSGPTLGQQPSVRK